MRVCVCVRGGANREVSGGSAARCEREDGVAAITASRGSGWARSPSHGARLRRGRERGTYVCTLESANIAVETEDEEEDVHLRGEEGGLGISKRAA